MRPVEDEELLELVLELGRVVELEALALGRVVLDALEELLTVGLVAVVGLLLVVGLVLTVGLLVAPLLTTLLVLPCDPTLAPVPLLLLSLGAR